LEGLRTRLLYGGAADLIDDLVNDTRDFRIFDVNIPIEGIAR